MTDDLTTRLGLALRAQERGEDGTVPTPDVLDDVRARIVRVRRRRVASHVAVAAVTALVLGCAGWFGFQARPAPAPADTPTPTSPPPTVEPSPTAEAEAETPAPALEPVSLPGLPAIYRLPEGVLERTGPGWFLASYASGLYDPPPGDGERRVLVLSAPTGELFHVMDVEQGMVLPVRWTDAGTVRAVVSDGERPHRAATVDLLTGDVVADERVPAGAEWVGLAGDDELWMEHGTTTQEKGVLHVLPPSGPARQVPGALWHPLLSPDGRTVVGLGQSEGGPVALDVTTGRRTTLQEPTGQRCTVAAWLDPTSVLAACVDAQPEGSTERWNHDERGGQAVRLDVTGGAPRTLRPITADGIVPWGGRYLRDQVAVVLAAPLLSSTVAGCYDFCYGHPHVWEGDTARPLATSVDLGDDVCELQVGGDRLLLRTGDLCYEETTGNQWWSVDPVTGATRLVAPAVDSELQIGAYALVERS